MADDNSTVHIIVIDGGPYLVKGGLSLVRKKQVVSEHGEPMTWETSAAPEPPNADNYALCRCGASSNKPFCDGTHAGVDWDGTETAPESTTPDKVFEGSGITVKRDFSLCMDSGFCGNRFKNIEKMMKDGDEEDSVVRAQIIAMVERCPSGSYQYALKEDEDNLEPDYPVQVAATTDVTDDGDIMGALWVTGNVEIRRADGKPLETRNRVTLCRCGKSGKKPLCDGTHRKLAIVE
ncbi:MAG: CDGSH iron-sulfur domain-containing protein [Chloroflexota bacterium]